MGVHVEFQAPHSHAGFVQQLNLCVRPCLGIQMQEARPCAVATDNKIGLPENDHDLACSDISPLCSSIPIRWGLIQASRSGTIQNLACLELSIMQLGTKEKAQQNVSLAMRSNSTELGKRSGSCPTDGDSSTGSAVIESNLQISIVIVVHFVNLVVPRPGRRVPRPLQCIDRVG